MTNLETEGLCVVYLDKLRDLVSVRVLPWQTERLRVCACSSLTNWETESLCVFTLTIFETEGVSVLYHDKLRDLVSVRVLPWQTERLRVCACSSLTNWETQSLCVFTLTNWETESLCVLYRDKLRDWASVHVYLDKLRDWGSLRVLSWQTVRLRVWAYFTWEIGGPYVFYLDKLWDWRSVF